MKLEFLDRIFQNDNGLTLTYFIDNKEKEEFISNDELKNITKSEKGQLIQFIKDEMEDLQLILQQLKKI